jgi:hypothetical protein
LMRMMGEAILDLITAIISWWTHGCSIVLFLMGVGHAYHQKTLYSWLITTPRSIFVYIRFKKK